MDRRGSWRVRARFLVAVVAGLVSCGRDATAPEPPSTPLAVTLTVQPGLIVPGQVSIVTARAEISDSQTLSRFELAITGFSNDTVLPLPIVGRGTHAYFVEIRIPNGPIAGTLGFHARAWLGTIHDSASGTLRIVDDGPPRIIVSAPAIVEPPASLTIAFDAQDAAGITDLIVHVEGAVQRDTVIKAAYAPRVEWSFVTPIPSSARLGDSVRIQVQAVDGFGKTSALLRAVRLIDTTPPALSARVDTIHHAGVDESVFPMVFFPGDTVHIRLTVSDRHSVTWLGYRMLDTGDSIRASGPSDSAHFTYVIPPGTNTQFAAVSAFTSDSSGNRAGQIVWAVAMDGTFRPVEALSPYEHPLIEYDQQGGYVLDAKRDVLYWARFDAEVEVVGLSPLRTLPPIALGGSVRSVDLTAGGDTLVAVVVGQPNALILWDVTGAPVRIDSIPVTLLGDCEAWDMQLTASGRAFVTGWGPSGCPTVEVDLLTRAQRVRAIPWALRNLVASGDHNVIVAWNQEEAMVYRAASDTMTPVRALHPAPTTSQLAHAGPALDHTGASVLIRNRLYTADLADSRWIQPDPRYLPPAPAISADGQTAYVGAWPGYVRVDVATGLAEERIILPRVPWRMFVHPDGERLVVFGWRWVGVVDLR